MPTSSSSRLLSRSMTMRNSISLMRKAKKKSMMKKMILKAVRMRRKKMKMKKT